jgi:hypothetical protein
VYPDDGSGRYTGCFQSIRETTVIGDTRKITRNSQKKHPDYEYYCPECMELLMEQLKERLHKYIADFSRYNTHSVFLLAPRKR